MKKFKKLIFIDDDKATNYFHNIILKQADICEEAIFFESAVEALEYFKELFQTNDYVLPDYVFLDINMPMMNGWEFINELKKFQLDNPIIIIMLTTSLNKTDQEKAEELDLIYEFWNKPLASNKLLELIKVRQES